MVNNKLLELMPGIIADLSEFFMTGAVQHKR
jgi:hypothetical protein